MTKKILTADEESTTLHPVGLTSIEAASVMNLLIEARDRRAVMRVMGMQQCDCTTCATLVAAESVLWKRIAEAVPAPCHLVRKGADEAGDTDATIPERFPLPDNNPGAKMH